MSESDPRWLERPILRELFEQWRKNRWGANETEVRRPFFRDWEQLLADAGLVTAEDRRAADRDVRAIAQAGLLKLKTPKYRPYEIERVFLPNEALPQWRSLFASELPVARAPLDLTHVRWAPELAFLENAPTTIAPEDLLKLNEFYQAGGRHRPVVPIKERSLQIFGDEKRLDALLSSSLFRMDRLTPESLRCEIVMEPPGWKRGPSADGPVLVLENAATWHSYARWNQECGAFSAVVYGGGNRFIESSVFLQEILREVGGRRRVLYFGDLDAQGLRIPCRASTRTVARDLPPVEPDLWSYRRLLQFPPCKKSDEEEDSSITAKELAWLGPLATPVGELLLRREWIPQEHLGWEFLSRQERWMEEI